MFCKVDHRDTKREIQDINFYEKEEKTIVEFKASSFLWEQIRRIISYILNYNKLEEPLQDTKELLTTSTETTTLNLQPAEPKNLILIEHFYENLNWERNDKALKDVRESLKGILNKIEEEKAFLSTIHEYFLSN